VEERLPEKLKNVTENRKRILDWTGTVVLLVLLGMMALQIVIWSVFF
jgi:lipopolysaccharide/colanic/teichoic acid biosynthesis glycosyltransferase